jgi:uncharacterized protein (TIGR02569 family)
VGAFVLKPLPGDSMSAEELRWQAELFDSLECEGFRVARVRRSRVGALVVDGWTAWERVAGRHEERRWPDVVHVGERFHAALRGVPRPAFLAQRTDPWAIGDRVAWGETAAPDAEHLDRLLALVRPLAAPSQLVHGDLTGNVLFAESLPPAVIDFAPYWRPVGFASAVVVGDALVWEGADERLLNAVAHVDDFPQYLLRALIYRIVVDRLFRLDEPPRTDDDPYLAPVELACRLAAHE